MHKRYPDAAMSAGEKQVVVASSGWHLEPRRGGKELQQEHWPHQIGAA
jgi:hypothetical protein